MSDLNPWDYHRHLTRKALIAIARLIAQGRSDALIRHDESIGDDGWTLGCKAFQYARFQITNAAQTEGFDWLTIMDPSKQFIFKIGDVPVRFYKGEADEPSERTLRQTFSELSQLAFVFGREDGAGMAYRFAIETDFDGSISSIKFVGLRGDSPVFAWDVPYTEAVVTPPATPPTKGVELPKPEVRAPGADRGDKADQG
ncbi:MAG: hypothetical protein JSR47_07495 [Proteobacteria bacterium]|nr:hypothetical protein [Pseudomonadota bacterium]